jgi:predicted Zn-dependent protease
MRSSTYVEDIDQKSMHLCHNCRSELQIWQTEKGNILKSLINV